MDEYYIENNAVNRSVQTWEEGDIYFSAYFDSETTPKAKSLVLDHLAKGKRRIVLGAPFGIGKTSLSIHLTSTMASTFLENPNNENSYIPIFIPLKGKLKIVDEEEHSLDEILKLIAPEERARRERYFLYVTAWTNTAMMKRS